MRYFVLSDDEKIAAALNATLKERATADLGQADSLIVAPSSVSAFDLISSVWNDFIDDISWNKRKGEIYIAGSFGRRDIPFRLRRFRSISYDEVGTLGETGILPLNREEGAKAPLEGEVRAADPGGPCRDSHVFGQDERAKKDGSEQEIDSLKGSQPCRDSHVFGQDERAKKDGSEQEIDSIKGSQPCRDSHVFGQDEGAKKDGSEQEIDSIKGSQPCRDSHVFEKEAASLKDTPPPPTQPPTMADPVYQARINEERRQDVDDQWQIIYEEQQRKKRKKNKNIILVIFFIFFIVLFCSMAAQCSSFFFEFCIRRIYLWKMLLMPL